MFSLLRLGLFLLIEVTEQQIKRIAVFSNLQSASLSSLAQFAQIDLYHKGSIIIHEGDLFLPKLYAVLDGKLIARKISISGKETILRRLPGGEIFAAPALFGDRIAPATVSALEDSQIISVEKQALLDVIQGTPEVAIEILSCFNQRLQEMHQTIHGLISERAIVRLARLILYTAERYGVEKTFKGDCLNTKLPHQQIARTIGITYEECVRLMKKDLNAIIDYGRGGTIIIVDAPELKAIASV